MLLQLTELGPFTYTYGSKKYNIDFNDKEGTVRYREHRFFHFSKKMSCDICDEETKINSINIGALPSKCSFGRSLFPACAHTRLALSTGLSVRALISLAGHAGHCSLGGRVGNEHDVHPASDRADELRSARLQ